MESIPQDPTLSSSTNPATVTLPEDAAANLCTQNGNASGATDIGLRREGNEDALLCDPERGLFLVCDGMGGMEAGEKASQDARDTLDAFFTPERLAESRQAGPEAVQKLLQQGIRAAQDSLRSIVTETPYLEGMGTTVVIAILEGASVCVGNLGDSRAYRLRKGALEQLTRDHSIAAALVERGELTPEEARHHPMRNRLLAVIGQKHPCEPHVVSIPLEPGDQLILCSDGLWDMISEAEIIAILQAHAPEQAVAELITAANQAGGKDNISVIVYRRAT